jgi:hypothetical protein
MHGNISELVSDIRSVQEIFDDIMGDAEKLLDELQRLKTTGDIS